MRDEDFTKRDIGAGLLELFSPTIRVSALEDASFRQRLELVLDANIRLDSTGLTFGRSELFGAIRLLLGGAVASVQVQSKGGLSCKMVLREGNRSILLLREGGEVPLPDFSCLAPDSKMRLAWFDREAEKYEFQDDRSKKWREILGTRIVEDEEVDPLLSELRLTPLWVVHSIADYLRREEITASSLVPSDIRYYERLVGELKDQTELKDFVAATATASVQKWIRARPFEGLKRTLLLSSHASFVQAVDLKAIPREDVLRLYNWLEGSGDRISQLGAIECGLAQLDVFPELEATLAKMIQVFLSDDPDEAMGRPTLSCSLIMMVEGEIARTGIARGRAPFWRRLAAIAHASLVEREMIAIGLPPADFHRWVLQNCGSLFYLQSLVDLRREPRWLPDFMTSAQLKAEFIGRIAGAAHANAAKVQTYELKRILFGEIDQGIKSQLKFPFAYLPGPLEGGVESVVAMPADFESELQNGLGSDELSPQSFAGLLNCALIFRVSPQLAEIAAQALRRVNHHLRELGTQNETFSLLSGLAMVAAITRSDELAEEVRKLVRVIRRRPGTGIDVKSSTRIAMIASAGYQDGSFWCKSVGDWLTELAFEDMSRENAVILGDQIHSLCKLEPHLWETCSRANTACTAFVASAAGSVSSRGMEG